MNTHAIREPRFGPGALATRANAITLARLVLAVPLLVLIARDGASWLAVAGWVVLGATDGLDGWVARRDGTTRSGAFLDPIADKFLIVGGFIALAVRGTFAWLPVVLIAAREALVSAYRVVMGRRGVSVPAKQLGKFKTNVQLVAVGVAVLPPTRSLAGLHEVLLWVAVAITFVSGGDIVFRGARQRT